MIPINIFLRPLGHADAKTLSSSSAKALAFFSVNKRLSVLRW